MGGHRGNPPNGRARRLVGHSLFPPTSSELAVSHPLVRPNWSRCAACTTMAALDHATTSQIVLAKKGLSTDDPELSKSTSAVSSTGGIIGLAVLDQAKFHRLDRQGDISRVDAVL